MSTERTRPTGRLTVHAGATGCLLARVGAPPPPWPRRDLDIGERTRWVSRGTETSRVFRKRRRIDSSRVESSRGLSLTTDRWCGRGAMGRGRRAALCGVVKQRQPCKSVPECACPDRFSRLLSSLPPRSHPLLPVSLSLFSFLLRLFFFVRCTFPVPWIKRFWNLHLFFFFFERMSIVNSQFDCSLRRSINKG